MKDGSSGPRAERVEALGRTLGVRWFSGDGKSGGESRRKRHRSRTPSPAGNEDAEISNEDNESGKSKCSLK